MSDAVVAERERIIDSIDIFAAVEGYIGSAMPDPHPLYREMLAEHPVFLGDVETDRLGQPRSSLTPWEGPHFTVFGYDEVDAVLRDSGGFSSRVLERSMGKVMGNNILLMDDPDHRIHRLLVQNAFTRKAMEGWRRDFVEPLVEQYIDQLEDQGRMEFVTQFAMTYPSTVIHKILGLPPEQLLELQKLAAGLFLFDTYPAVAVSCADALADMINAHVADRRANPRDDIITVLANERLKNGEMLTDEEIVNFLRVLLPAGAETTTRLLGSMMTRLHSEPGLLERVRADNDLILGTTNEALRMEPPFQFAYRLALRDGRIADVDIPQGTTVALCIAAANRDPRRFANPESFDIDRTTPNLAFGLGMHLCLGLHLARMEADVAFRALLRRLPKLRLDEDKPAPRSSGVVMSSPGAVHVRWD